MHPEVTFLLVEFGVDDDGPSSTRLFRYDGPRERAKIAALLFGIRNGKSVRMVEVIPEDRVTKLVDPVYAQRQDAMNEIMALAEVVYEQYVVARNLPMTDEAKALRQKLDRLGERPPVPAPPSVEPPQGGGCRL